MKFGFERLLYYLIRFYIILNTFIQSQTFFYGPEHSYKVIFKILSNIYDGCVIALQTVFIEKKQIHYIIAITWIIRA